MKTVFFLTFAYATIPLAALADAPTSSAYAGNTTIQDIDTYHDEAAILQQKLLVAKLKAQLSGAASTANTAPADPSQLGSQVPTDPAGPSSATLPEVLDIDSVPGGGNRLTALLQMPNGMQITAYPGLGLPGGLTVYDITYNGVRVMSAGQLEVLPTVSSTDDLQAQAPSRPNVLMPGVVPMPSAMSMSSLPMPRLGTP